MQTEINLRLVYRVLKLLKILLPLVYRIEYWNSERLPRSGGFLMVVNHQYHCDIPFEGLLLYQILGRHAFYIMQANLPKRLTRLGGLSINRRKEVVRATREAKRVAGNSQALRASFRQARMAELDEARRIKEENYSIVLDSLSRGQIVVMHPQKTRRPKMPFQPSLDVMREIVRLGERMIQLGQPGLTVVPVRISYLNPYITRSRVQLTVGEPILLSGQVTALMLKEHLLEQIQT